MRKVKVLGVAWSPRHSNTELQLKAALDAARELPGVETTYYSIAGKDIAPCISCYACDASYGVCNKEDPCVAHSGNGDAFTEIINLMHEADAIIFACPVYFYSVTAQLKAFMDRSMSVEMCNLPWRNKVFGCITSAYHRNGGQEHTLEAMINWAKMMDMVTVGMGPEREGDECANYMGVAGMQGYPFQKSNLTEAGMSAVMEDPIGVAGLKYLGWRVVEMTKIVCYGIDQMQDDEWKWEPHTAVRK